MREGSGGRLTGGGLDPKQFAHAVLQNCGQIRLKDQSVGQTEIGADFLRKAGGLRSPDPARTFFGPSVQSMKFGLTARTEAQDSAGGYALRKPFGGGQKERNRGLFSTASGQSSIMLISNGSPGGDRADRTEYAGSNTNMSGQSNPLGTGPGFKGRMNFKRHSNPTGPSTMEYRMPFAAIQEGNGLPPKKPPHFLN